MASVQQGKTFKHQKYPSAVECSGFPAWFSSVRGRARWAMRKVSMFLGCLSAALWWRQEEANRPWALRSPNTPAGALTSRSQEIIDSGAGGKLSRDQLTHVRRTRNGRTCPTAPGSSACVLFRGSSTEPARAPLVAIGPLYGQRPQPMNCKSARRIQSSTSPAHQRRAASPPSMERTRLRCQLSRAA